MILVRRKIVPNKSTWALPGLQLMKPERIGDTLKRIAQIEIGITIDSVRRESIDQYVSRFQKEHQRQDLSTCYAIPCDARDVVLNQDHFSRSASSMKR